MCDPMWQVTPRSSEMGSRKELYAPLTFFSDDGNSVGRVSTMAVVSGPQLCRRVQERERHDAGRMPRHVRRQPAMCRRRLGRHWRHKRWLLAAHQPQEPTAAVPSARRHAVSTDTMSYYSCDDYHTYHDHW